MRKRASLLLPIALVVGGLAATPTYAAKNAEQVVFSTPGSFPPSGGMTLTGTTPSGGDVTPLGFWVWCIAEPGGPPSNGVYGADMACQGSMYFYALGHPEHVFGAAFLGNGTGIVENPPGSGLYTMTVEATDFCCTLKNKFATQTNANTNTVIVDCTFRNALAAAGTGHAEVTNSVVNVTGP